MNRMQSYEFATVVKEIQGGSTAKIVGDPIRVQRSYIERMAGAVKSVGGADYVMIFPVRFDYYQQTAFVHQDHMHLSHGQLA